MITDCLAGKISQEEVGRNKVMIHFILRQFAKDFANVIGDSLLSGAYLTGKDVKELISKVNVE